MKKLFLLLLTFTVFSFAEEIRVAVIDLNANEVEQNDANNISNRLRTEFLSINNFTCIERNQMQEILEENGFEKLECKTNDCAVEMGKLLGVSYVIPGIIGKIGEMYSLNLRIIKVESGEIISAVNKDCKCPIEDVFTTTTREAVKEITNLIIEKIYSGIEISTNPSGASVFFNDEEMGSTPYQNEKITPDTYDIKVKLDTYETIKKSIVLSGGETEKIALNLVHSQQYMDSLKAIAALKAEMKAKKAKEEAEKKAAAEKENKIKKIKLISRIALGTFTAGFIAGSYYMDMQVQDKMELKEQLYNNCKSSSNQQQLDKYKDEYDKAHNDGEDLTKYRTLFYVGAGVTAACFGVTFFF